MDQIWRHAEACEGLSSSLSSWLFPCLSYCLYPHHTEREVPSPARLVAWYASWLPTHCAQGCFTGDLCKSCPWHGHACCTWPGELMFPQSLWLFFCRFAVWHKEVSPIQRGCGCPAERTWQCDDSQALTWLNNLHMQYGFHLPSQSRNWGNIWLSAPNYLDQWGSTSGSIIHLVSEVKPKLDFAKRRKCFVLWIQTTHCSLLEGVICKRKSPNPKDKERPGKKPVFLADENKM